MRTAKVAAKMRQQQGKAKVSGAGCFQVIAAIDSAQISAL
jgi:hypothetical protein